MNDISSKIHEQLRRVYHYSSFRPGQEDIITSILTHHDTLAILPTGGGKSICYQIPALLFPELCIIISPLISLMKDQVETLQKKGVAAACLNSTLSREEERVLFQQLRRRKIHILYLSPERLTSSRFGAFLKDASLPISFLCVDEAHCISQWGQEFRPSYQHIIDFITDQPVRPVIAAFTATAAPTVRDEIISCLKLHEPSVFTMGFDRTNLYYEVRHTSRKWDELVSLLQQYRGQSGIIYAMTQKTVVALAKKLTACGIHALPYHGGMTAQQRADHQTEWINGSVKLMVATNAFGMGIDKPDVRFVIHYNMPKDLEDYYQEAGRAGRDGLPSDCILLVDASDLAISRRFIAQTVSHRIKRIEREKLHAMMEYAGGEECLRESLLRYFGERAPSFCGHCSVCLKKGPFPDEAALPDREDPHLYAHLKALRAEIAARTHRPAETIMSTSALHDLACRRPESITDLIFMESTPLISSIKYGADFLSEIRAWNHSHLS